MIKSSDVGSLPLLNDAETFLEGAARFPLSPTERTAKHFERVAVEAFLDKLRTGLNVPTYPQFRDMNKMFLEMMDGVAKTKEGFTETCIPSLKAGGSCIPEVSVIEKSSKRFFEKTGKPYQIRICITGPYTLSSLFINRGGAFFSRMGEIISQIVENSLFNGKYGGVSLIALDEPVFGLLDDPLIDWGSEGREFLIRAWETILHKANSKGVQTSIHLHNTVDSLFWDVESLNIIESHVDDSLYQLEKTSELLESTDKFLKASISLTDFDRLIRERVIATSRQKMSESAINEAVARTWKHLGSGKLDSKSLLETDKLMRKRLIKLVDQFGVERIPYAGPECGLRGFPTYECALECLKRVSSAVGRANR